MRTIFGWCILLTITLSLNAQSPIVITNADMPVKNDTLRYTDVNVGDVKDYLSTGENFEWDFSMVKGTGEGVRKFESPSSTPYKFFFFGANAYGEKIPGNVGAGPITITDNYNFYSKQVTPLNAFCADGVGLTFSSIPLPAYYTDRDELYVFPLTYGNRDSTEFRFSTLTTSLLPISYSKTGHRITEVDGWGTIKTPYGSEECIRLVTTQYATDSIKITLLPFPLGFPNVVRSYQWLTLKGKIPYFEVTGTLVMDNFMPNTVRYRGTREGKKTGLTEDPKTTLKMYPNPVNDKLIIEGISAGSLYQITSVSGAVIITGQIENAVAVDVSLLSKGVYFIQVQSNATSINYRFVKE